MSKKLDPDFRALKMCVKALGKIGTKRMQRPTLEYLWDRFILHPKPLTQPGNGKRSKNDYPRTRLHHGQ